MNNNVLDTSFMEAVEDAEKKSTIVNKIRLIFYCVIKRVFDIFCSILGIVLMIPVTIFVKIGYMLTGDFKSIFYRQKRIGKHGKIIGIFKYRSMIPNADKVLQKLLQKKKYKRQWMLNQKLDDDPRITKIGKILRKTSLDELPQFLNVLKNDMSMIGPRPLVKGELDAHHGNHEIYESVKPGITGWWASHGRSATNYEERLELEYFYVRNRGIILDIRCIIDTVKAILTRNGAK